MEKLDWGFISALISVAVGWFLNELSQWFRVRKEDKRIKKEVLFNLLETHFTLRRIDMSEYVTLVTDRVMALYPEEQRTEKFRKELLGFYTQTAKQMIKMIISDKQEILVAKYTNAIDNLAKIDPITAYRLNGKANVMQVFEAIEASLSSALTDLVGQQQQEVQSQLSQAMDYIKPNMLTETIDDLEDELISIGWSINPIIYYKIRSTLKKYRKDKQKETKETVDKLIKSMSQNMGIN